MLPSYPSVTDALDFSHANQTNSSLRHRRGLEDVLSDLSCTNILVLAPGYLSHSSKQLHDLRHGSIDGSRGGQAAVGKRDGDAAEATVRDDTSHSQCTLFGAFAYITDRDSGTHNSRLGSRLHSPHR
jgi:hypothetical protein